MGPDDDALLDRAFLALADPVRRRIVARLSRGPATVTELAEPFEISKQAVSKHIQVLEQAQLVTRTRDAQRRPVHLDPARLEALTAWIDRYRLVREEQFRRLDAVLETRAAPRGAHREESTMGHALHLTVPDDDPYIDFQRDFDVPVAELYRAHADPELFRQWIGPRGLVTRIDGFDFRAGGAYRFVQRGEDSAEEYAFRGVFHTVRENELVVQTFEYEGWPDAVDLEYLRFEDLGGGRCRLRGHTVHASREARDGMVGSGMEKGMAEGYERLEELLAGLLGGQGG